MVSTAGSMFTSMDNVYSRYHSVTKVVHDRFVFVFVISILIFYAREFIWDIILDKMKHHSRDDSVIETPVCHSNALVHCMSTVCLTSRVMETLNVAVDIKQ